MICLSANGFVRGLSAVVPNATTENERSLCFLLTYDGFDYLIGGDTIGRADGAEDAKVEGAIGAHLLAQGVNVDILRVNHHGADNASAVALLDAIKPEIAIVSVGNKNSHGHPVVGALERLSAAGVTLIDQTEAGDPEDNVPAEVQKRRAVFQGNVVVTTDGKKYDISTKRTFEVDD